VVADDADDRLPDLAIVWVGTGRCALSDLAERTTLEPFARFVHGLMVAIERGTPLDDMLRAQAADVREAGKRALLEAGGRKEVSMMVPIVYFVTAVASVQRSKPGVPTLLAGHGITTIGRYLVHVDDFRTVQTP
jgi:hypothetical protein